MAAVTVNIYDAILMLPQEIVLVWNAKFSLIRAAYVSSRYIVCVAILLVFTGEYTLFLYLDLTSSFHIIKPPQT